MSLTTHLTSSAPEHGRLGFHPDCPRCQAERLGGSLAGDSLVSRRTQAALAAGVLALSSGAPPAAAQLEGDVEQEGSAEAGASEPGLEPQFDPGGDDTLDVDSAPLPGGGEAGGAEDEGEGAPVESEPSVDPNTRIVPEGALPEPESAPAPEPATPPLTTPTPAPTPLATPAPPVAPPAPLAPPVAEVDQPTADSPKTATKRDGAERAAKPQRPARQHKAESPQPPPAPANPTPAPVVEVPAVRAPAAVPVSQQAEPPGGPATGSSYTVRAGDSLWSIARWMLGPEASAGRIARQVNRLWQLNEQRIGTGDPNLLHVGTVLRLP